MNSSVIQGSFPHGLSRLRSGLQQHASPNAAALQLPASLARLPEHGGQPLPLPVRQRMEAAFGTSFGDVRIHIGQHAQSLGTPAFTRGANIHFAPAHYETASARGQQLLAHELAHVVQQRSGRVRNPFNQGVAVIHDVALEAEAGRLSHQAIRNAAAPPAIQPMTPDRAAKLRVIQRTIDTMHRAHAPTSVQPSVVIQAFGTMVNPEDEPWLVQHIVNYRNAQGYHQYAFAHGGHNVAVVWNGAPPGAGNIWATAHSNGGNHGEVNVDAAINPNQANVTRIHTEREPCVNCATFITNNYITPGILTAADVTYWGEYQNNRDVGTKDIKVIINTGYEKMAMDNIGNTVTRSGRNTTPNPKYV